jgi:glucose-1-phosphate cytidylyltransferase
LSEETICRPKPMVEIGGYPLMWHLVKICSAHDVNDCVVCLGYKGYTIKECFSNYFLHSSDVTFGIAKNSMEVHHRRAEPWRVTLVDMGNESMAIGRIKRTPYVEQDPSFWVTYGDGVGDIGISASIKFHNAHMASLPL